MRIVHIKNTNNEVQKEEILQLLMKCDNEFYPPLSERRKERFPNKNQKELLEVYLNEKDKHHHLLAYEEATLIGYVNFMPSYDSPNIKGYEKSIHIDTTCVHPEYRSNGIAQVLYKYMESEITKELNTQVITRETWSLNEKQLYLYSKLGYSVLNVEKDARGKGVDSLLYGKKVEGK